MEVAGQREFLKLKMGYLETQRAKLVTMINDYVNKVLHQGNAWLGEAGKNVPLVELTFTEISQVMENTAMFVIKKCEEIAGDKKAVDDTALKHSKAAEEREARVRKLEKGLELITGDVKKISSHMGFLESSLNYDKQIESMKKKTEKLDDMRQKVEKLETVVNRVEKLEALGQKFKEQHTLEQQRAKKVAVIEQTTQKLEATTAAISSKVDTQGTKLQELTKSVEANTRESKDGSREGKDIAKLREVQEKLAMVEKVEKRDTKKLEKRCGELEAKQKMMSKIMAERITPLEQLRGIFNKKLMTREDNVKKLHEVVEQMSVLKPKVCMLETSGFKQPVAFTAVLADLNKPVQDATASDYHEIYGNNEKHFNPETGLFTAPFEGLYGMCVIVWQTGDTAIPFKVMKTSSGMRRGVEYLHEAITDGKDCTEPCFLVVNMEVGDKLYIYMNVEEQHPKLKFSSSFSCFLIG